MLVRVTGPAGSGKTEYLYGVLEQAFREGKSCVWIAPEQQSVQAEREILTRLGDGSNLSVEVLNFERLPERVARTYGGLTVRYPDPGALRILLSMLAEEHRGELSEYASCVRDEDFVSGLLGLFGRLRSEMITPERLFAAAEKEIPGDEEKLKRKLSDVGILYRAYSEYFTDACRDPRDALSVLASELPDKPFFSGKTVFVDGYYTFTGQEYALLYAIMKQADDLYCTFSFDGRELFAGNEGAAFRLARHAPVYRDVSFPEFRRSDRDEIRFLEKYLWSEETPAFSGKAGSVRLIRASDPFAEANAAAAEILRLVREGRRFRDVTVLTRNPGDYAGVLDAVLRENRIPFYFSGRENILTNPLTAFVCASVELADTDFSLSALRKYLKTGYSGLEAEDADALLRYAESWGLRGKDWLSGEDWTRNPDGFREGEPDEEQSAFLAAVNRSRKKLLGDFLPLRAELKRNDRTTDTMLAALYAHLERVGAGERFTEKVNRLLKAGEEESARRESRVWAMLSGVFDRLHELCGDKKQPASRLLSLLRLAAGACSPGAIPASSDSVSVGDPSLLRPDRARAVILLGCNDGVFPAAAGSDPLFDDGEAGILESIGIEAVEPRLSRLTAERFYFYNAVSSPSEELVFTYPASTLSGEALRPSPAILRVKALLPELKERYFDDAPENALYSAESAANVFSLLPEGKEKERLRSVLAEKGLTPSGAPQPLSDPSARIGYRGDSLRVSASGLERYRYCPFSYFGSHVMNLKEKKRNRFASPEIGTFIHRILELFFASHTASGRFVPPESESALEAEAEALARRVFQDVTGEAGASGRMLHLFRNLRKTLVLLLSDLSEEFRESAFLPIGFEVGIGMGKGSLPALGFVCEDGKKAYFCGSVDRVDACDRDGVRYIRVVDYKTYGKTLRLDYAEEHGLDEQMLLYLFAYCRSAAKEGETLRPAGVLYSAALLPFVEVSGETAPEEIREKLLGKLDRTGVVLADEDVVLAMDPARKERYAPVKYDGDGRPKPSRYMLPASEFRRLEELIDRQLRETAQCVFDGKMDVSPLKKDPLYDACHYCKFRAACRRKEED